MSEINDFYKIREDRKIIPEDMAVSQMLALDWAPCIVVEVHWKSDEENYQLSCPQGLLAMVVADRQHVVTLEDNDDNSLRLFIVSSNGKDRREVSRTVELNGKIRSGKYLWFENGFAMPDNAFCVAFEAQGDSAMHYLYIDSTTGVLLKAQYFR